MGEWAWWAGGGMVTGAALAAGGAYAVLHYYRAKHLDQIARIFEEKPLFVIPHGKPAPGAEDVHFETSGGLTLRGCYLSGRGPRKGVILFGLEFGSNRWACVPYCSALLDRGYDVFAYEPRNQGESDKDSAYHPLQWVTDRDITDMRAALTYLKKRKDAPADGVGVFGVSKGGSVALEVAAGDPWVRCVATDGAYGTYTTLVPYMRRWVSIYVKSSKRVRNFVPDWFYGRIGMFAVRESARRRGVTFVPVERALRRLNKPLLMIHGAADTYIKADMAQSLHARAASAKKSLWLVAGAKHNQALVRAGDDYIRKLAAFFAAHLPGGHYAATAPFPSPTDSGQHKLRLAG